MTKKYKKKDASKKIYKRYSFHDTFIKTCEFKNGQGDCKKTRESKKCINNDCEVVKIPMSKKDVLNDYYKDHTGNKYKNTKIKQIGYGGNTNTNNVAANNNTFKCPYCNQIFFIKDLTNHIKTHTHSNINPTNTFDKLFPDAKPINKSFDELFPQFGGCDSCINMVGGCGDSCMTGGCGDSCMTGGKRKSKNKFKNEPGPDPELKSQLLLNLQNKNKNKYKCPLCDKYKYISNMKQHAEEHAEEGKYREFKINTVPTNSPLNFKFNPLKESFSRKMIQNYASVSLKDHQ